MGLGSGFRGQKGTGSRIRIRNTATNKQKNAEKPLYQLLCDFLMTVVIEDCCKSRKSMTKRAGAGSGVRNPVKGSKDPDPSQNVTDPEHF